MDLGLRGKGAVVTDNPSGVAFADDAAAWEGTPSVNLMAAVRASWMTGTCLVVDGGRHKANQ